ncbi:MAG: protease inhibitor I42 family protein, partial [Ignavibacteria bacterium]|nr:protease inhibitor I42 family protein [Ignavibacteria bacterium]
MKAKIFSINLFLIISVCYAQDKNYTVPDTAISVSQGELFTISLDANHSTGYSWAMGMNPEDGEVLINGYRFITDDVPPGVIGAGGTEVWSFRAKKKGNVTLNFYYMRPWENEAVRTE